MAKVTLSAAEMNLVTQQDFILTKNKIITKVYELLGNVNEFYKNELESQNFLPKEILLTNAKISRGENYNQLPWVMLDYPRYFKQDDALAIRTFFWWGNFMSIHFLVQGKYVELVKNSLLNKKNMVENWFICHHQNPWQHHFEVDNYLPISHFTKQEIINLQFIKQAKKIPLQEWDNIEMVLQESFLQLVQLLKTSFLNDEKAL